MRRIRPILLCITLVVLVGCGGEPSARLAATRTDSSGVEIVMNRGPDAPLAWQFTERFRLGGAAEGPESFYQVNRALVGTDDHGNVYVLNRPASRIDVFDSGGRHLRGMGSSGGGPGEFQRPGRLAVDPAGNVGVWDFAKRGFVRFASDGSVQDQGRWAAPGSPMGFALRGDTILVAVQHFGDNGATVLHVLSSVDTTELVRVPLRLGGPVIFDCGVGLSMSTPVFMKALTWHARQEWIATNVEPGYVIDVYQNGRLVRSIRREYELQPATPELAVRELGQGQTIRVGGRGDCVIPPEEVVEKQGMADFVPTVSQVMLGPDGTLWVGRHAFPDEPPVVDVFAPDGEYLGTLSDFTIPVAILADGAIVTRETDQSDVQHLVILDVEKL